MSVKIDGDYGTMHRILKILAWRYAKASELAEMLGISRQAVYYHLKRLVEWGFVVRNTRECIMSIMLNPDKDTYLYYDKKGKIDIIKGDECKPNEQGEYYVYAVNYYLRKIYPERPQPSSRDSPSTFIDIVRNRLEELGVLNEVKGYDLILMAAILNLMAAILWNPAPRGDSYWVRLKHLTTRGIHRKIGKFISWYISMKAATEAKKRHPIPTCAISKEQRILIRKQRSKEYHLLLREYYDEYYPSLKKVRWILARMYDYLIVERLGGDHCPYGIWVPHPSLFSPNKKPSFHLPRHKHVTAKHRYKSLNVKRSLTDHHDSDNHGDNQTS